MNYHFQYVPNSVKLPRNTVKVCTRMREEMKQAPNKQANKQAKKPAKEKKQVHVQCLKSTL